MILYVCGVKRNACDFKLGLLDEDDIAYVVVGFVVAERVSFLYKFCLESGSERYTVGCHGSVGMGFYKYLFFIHG